MQLLLPHGGIQMLPHTDRAHKHPAQQNNIHHLLYKVVEAVCSFWCRCTGAAVRRRDGDTRWWKLRTPSGVKTRPPPYAAEMLAGRGKTPHVDTFGLYSASSEMTRAPAACAARISCARRLQPREC